MKVDLDKMRLPVKVGSVTFKNPFYVGSGPTSKSIDHLVKAAEMGWAGASIKLTFDPAPYVSLEPRYGWWDEQGFLSFSAESRLNVEEGIRLVEEGRRRTKDFLIMANITYIGDKPGITGWVDMAKRFESAGAHIIELNMCCPNMSYNVSVSGTHDTKHQTGASLGQNAEAIGHIVGEVVKGVKIPVFVKLTPEGGRIAQVAKAAYDAGATAAGGAANRLGIPMVDIYNPRGGMYELQKEPSMSCMSGPWIRPLAFRDIYEIRKLNGTKPFVTCSGGIMTMEDVVMATMCGGDLMCVCTGILLEGFELLPKVIAELKAYMDKMGYKKLSDARDILVQDITPATKLTVYKGVAHKKYPFLRGPCHAACPFEVPAQDYVTLVAEGDFQGAHKMITSRNPLQSICGWVCNHPCEKECTRGMLDDPIRIRDIKRFVLEKAAKERWTTEIVKGPARKEKVAVVGSGPAGLSAAHHLARAGYPVTLYESQEKAGGMLRCAIPRFRLPEAVLDAEIKAITDLGVKLVCGKTLGKDFTVASLKKDGFKAVVLAVGAGAGLPLGIPGEDGHGSMTALEFLGNVSSSKKAIQGKRVAVIGGGFTAVDSARTAARLGAKEVYLLYRRTRAEMPATSEEVDEAEAEGVKVMYLVSPKELVRSNGGISALRMVNHVLGKGDASGRRRPEEVEGTEFTLKVDLAISAVSQGLGADGKSLGVKVEKDRIAIKGGAATSVAGVFAAGDAVTGPDNIIGAVAGGYAAAVAADAFLAGKAHILEPNPELTPADKELVLLRNRKEVRRERVKPELRPAEKRKGDFETYLKPMTEAEAIAEATRCLRCGCSETCGICHRICSSFAINLEKDGFDIAKDKCHACGMCAQLCPNKNIEMVAEETAAAKH